MVSKKAIKFFFLQQIKYINIKKSLQNTETFSLQSLTQKNEIENNFDERVDVTKLFG